MYEARGLWKIALVPVVMWSTAGINTSWGKYHNEAILLTARLSL